jgi:hypothetical protein
MVRIVLTVSIFVVSALALGGCAASTQVTQANAVSTTHLRSAPIPGEMEFNYEDTREAKTREDVQALSYRHNEQERPCKGAIHPAMH